MYFCKRECQSKAIKRKEDLQHTLGSLKFIKEERSPGLQDNKGAWKRGQETEGLWLGELNLIRGRRGSYLCTVSSRCRDNVTGNKILSSKVDCTTSVIKHIDLEGTVEPTSTLSETEVLKVRECKIRNPQKIYQRKKLEDIFFFLIQ